MKLSSHDCVAALAGCMCDHLQMVVGLIAMNLLISYSLRLTQGDAALVIPNLPYGYIIHVALIAIPCASLIASFQPPLIMLVVIC